MKPIINLNNLTIESIDSCTFQDMIIPVIQYSAGGVELEDYGMLEICRTRALLAFGEHLIHDNEETKEFVIDSEGCTFKFKKEGPSTIKHFSSLAGDISINGMTDNVRYVSESMRAIKEDNVTTGYEYEISHVFKRDGEEFVVKNKFTITHYTIDGRDRWLLTYPLNNRDGLKPFSYEDYDSDKIVQFIRSN